MPPIPSGTRLEVIEEAGRTVARFASGTALTEANAEDVGRDLAALVAGRTRPTLALDLGGVDVVTSLALAKFLALNSTVREAGGHLTLLNLKPLVHQIFLISRLDRVLDVQPAVLRA